ncbi:hypothetical protein L195_g032789 [Trifolium pratense]|uniref:Putative plant transposon protein domain-containing protein n=1 Tax=Trifolium pratense TaxID=57577 RepID=A0A2K3LE81_TRIPR|nr:hypothetical protein L195_g032789 [Trifolium pratense]
MKPLPKAWSHFVVQNIVTNSNVTEVTIKRAAIIQAIMAGESINFGRLIRNDIRRIAEERQGAFSLGHCALINALCEMDGVERIHGDIDEPVKGILTYAWYAKQPVGPMPPEHQQHPNEPVEEHPQEMEEVLFPQPPPTPHFNTYNFAMANFAEDLAGMMLTDVPQFEQDFKSAADTYRQAHPQHPYTRYQGDREAMMMHLTHQRQLLELRQQQTIELFDRQERVAKNLGGPSSQYHSTGQD